MLAGDQAATKRYLTFLAAGGSKYPIDLLKDAGVEALRDGVQALLVEVDHRHVVLVVKRLDDGRADLARSDDDDLHR